MKLFELGGIDGARDVQLQGPRNDKPTRLKPSEDDGQNEYNPDVQGIQDEHRSQIESAISTALDSLETLMVALEFKDETEPKYEKIKTQTESLQELLKSVDFSQVPLDAPPATGGGVARDPTGQYW